MVEKVNAAAIGGATEWCEPVYTQNAPMELHIAYNSHMWPR